MLGAYPANKGLRRGCDATCRSGSLADMAGERSFQLSTKHIEQRCRIRVWFGDEVICSHVADPDEAERYAALMARRFAGLAVTIDSAPGPRDAELPHHLLWEQTVR
jgi:hypothetical protein